MKHTPTPWESYETRVYLSDNKGGFDIRNCPDAEANAAFIVKACNNHYQLLEVLKKARPTVLWRETHLTDEIDRLIEEIDQAIKQAEAE